MTADVPEDDLTVWKTALGHAGVLLVSNYNSAGQGIRSWLKPHQSFDFRHGGGLRGRRDRSAAAACDRRSAAVGAGRIQQRLALRTYYARLGKALRDETAYVEAVAAIRGLQGSIAGRSTAHLTLARQDAEALRQRGSAQEAEAARYRGVLDQHAAEADRLRSVIR